MTRVSLAESYDDRSVIAKLKQIEEADRSAIKTVTEAVASADAAAASAKKTADTFAGSVGAVVQTANAEIKASENLVKQAKAEVDTTVTTVAQAVQTANSASAAATQAAASVGDKVSKSDTGEQALAGSLKVSKDLSVEGRTTLAGQIEVAGMAIEPLGTSTKLSNGHGVVIDDLQIGDRTIGTDKNPLRLRNGKLEAVANELVDTVSAQKVGGTKTVTGAVRFPRGNDRVLVNCGGGVACVTYRQEDGYNSNCYVERVQDTSMKTRQLYQVQPYSESVRETTTLYTSDWNTTDQTGNQGYFATLVDSGRYYGNIRCYKGDGTYKSLMLFDIRDNGPVFDSSTLVTLGHVADYSGKNNLMHREGDEEVSGYKKMHRTPSLKRAILKDAGMNGKWVRVLTFSGNAVYGDFNLVLAFMSRNTTTVTQFYFKVLVNQRMQIFNSKRGIVLLENGCDAFPLAVGKAPVPGTSVGLKLVSDEDNGTCELWGVFGGKDSNAVMVDVERFTRINNTPGADGLYFDKAATGMDNSEDLDYAVTWDLKTFSDTEPVGARNNSYIRKSREDSE